MTRLARINNFKMFFYLLYRIYSKFNCMCIFFVSLISLYSTIYALNDGDTCIDHNRVSGTCVSLTNCEAALTLIDQKKSPKFCNANSEISFNALVCCPGTGQARPNQGQNHTSLKQSTGSKNKTTGQDEPYLHCVHDRVKDKNKDADSQKLPDPEIIDEGKPCNRSGIVGIYTRLSVCQTLINLTYKDGKTPNIYPASSNTSLILVCCRENEIISPRLSYAMCFKYHPNLYYLVYAAVQGIPARPKVYTHMALVGRGDADSITWDCGGSLISEKFVLTAAHCILTIRGSPEWVRLGELDTSTNKDDADPKDYKIVREIVHPKYDPPSVYHDIGLLELNATVKFTAYVKPACLYIFNDASSIPFVYATGWGATEFLGGMSTHLLSVYLKTVSPMVCKESYKDSAKTSLSDGINEEIQICAGGNNGMDTCQGDSGGPLQIPKPGTGGEYVVYDLVGVTSFGKACGIGANPGVYTKVYPYLSWIEENVWKGTNS